MSRTSFKIHYFIITIAGILIVTTILANVLAPYDPNKISLTDQMQGISMEHWLGTDMLGRDMFSRIIYGGRYSILLALLASTLSLLIGGMIGIIAGYYGGIVDTVITTITSIFQGLPSICLMIAISAMMGPGIVSLLIALVINSWASFSRIVRGEVMKVRKEMFIDGAVVMGASSIRIIALYIIPAILPDLIIVFASRIAATILSIAGLSYLGLGIQPPTPDWGVMVSEARSTFRSAPQLLIAPGMAILILSLGINYLAEIMRVRLSIKKNIDIYD